MSATDVVLASLAMAAGATVQGSTGFGQSLIAAPLLLLLDPGLVPGPAVVAGLGLNALMLLRDHGHADHTGIRWAAGGVVPGTIAAGFALAVLSDRSVAVVSASLILAAVGLSVVGLHPGRRPSTLVSAGVASGFMGTAAAIGGPPIALLYQDAGGPALRATLARFFLLAGVPTVVVLVAAGELGPDEAVAGLAMLPGIAAGFALSGPLRGHIHPVRARRAVLGISALSALLALARVLLAA